MIKQIPEAFTELIEWLKPLCRFNKIEDFIIVDYKENRLNLKIFTKDNSYSISAHLCSSINYKCNYCKNEMVVKAISIEELVYVECDKCHKSAKFTSKNSYLGCIASTRKPRAGENWNRGSDLVDGSYSKETFDKIIYDILAYELVKVAKQTKKLTVN